MFNWLLLTILLVVTFAFAAHFYRRQNQANWVGGPISTPKALWLAYTIFNWFLLPFVYLQQVQDPLIYTVIMLHLISWWARGPLELVMIYRWFNWSPIYGMTHDVVHIILIGSGLGYWVYTVWEALPFGLMLMPPWDLLGLVFLPLVLITTSFELAFAKMFLKVRGFKDHKIYFASDEEKYRKINQVTKIGVSIAYGHLVVQWLVVTFLVFK